MMGKISDMAFENPGKSSLALSPLVFTGVATGLYLTGHIPEDVHSFQEQVVALAQHYGPRLVLFPLLVWFPLYMGSITRPPRSKNFIPALAHTLQDSRKRSLLTTEKELEKAIASIGFLNYKNPNQDAYFKAKFHIGQGAYGPALDELALFLSTEEPSSSLAERILIDPFTTLIHKFRSSFGSKGDWFTYGLQLAFTKRTKAAVNFLESEPSSCLEERILKAIMISSFVPFDEGSKYWEALYRREQGNLSRIGETRNEVLEIPENEYTKGIVVIKRGSNLRRELQALQDLQTARIAARPLAFFKDEDSEVLIMYREDSENLDTFFEINHARLYQEAVFAMQALARFHNHKFSFPLPNHDPLQELERRFFSRFGENRFSNTLRGLFRMIYNKQGELAIGPIHGDAYPTNFLTGGKIIDPEKICLGSHWFDFEAFIRHPELHTFSELLAEDYLDARDTIGLGTSTRGRELAALVSSTCQIGSFSQKDRDTAEHFFHTTYDIAEQTGHPLIRDYLAGYLEAARFLP